MARPPLKWVGGKQSLVERLQAFVPPDYGTYHEPMVGAGALFFALEPERAEIGDTNQRLINYYRQVREHPETVIDHLESMPDPHQTDGNDREAYYQVRDRFNARVRGEEFDPIAEAARFQYLNRTGYNGLYRENQDGEYNVPIGRPPDRDWVLHDRVREASRVLREADTVLHHRDVGQSLGGPDEGDLVYFDPPYKPTDHTDGNAFVDFTRDGFEVVDQQVLARVAQSLDQMGVSVIISNTAAAAEMFDLPGFQTFGAEARRSVSADASTRGEVSELIITNTAGDAGGEG